MKPTWILGIIIAAIVVVAVGCWCYYSEISEDENVGGCIDADQYCSRFDVNNDGVIDFEDLVLVTVHITEPYDELYDMNCDGDVNQADVELLGEYYGCSPVDGPCNC